MLGAGTLDWQHDGVVLTKEQKQFYEKNGYLVVKNVVPKYELDRFYNRFKVTALCILKFSLLTGYL